MSAEEEHGHHGHGDDAHEHGHDHAHEHGHDHAHPHGHGHGHDGHGHAHPHGHHHAHARPAAHEGARPGLGKLPAIAPLARGAGAGLTLFLDPVAGIAGDMTIGALVDLGVPPRVVEDAVASLGLDGYRLVFGSRVHHGIVAAAFDVVVSHDQPHRTYRDVRALLAGASLARGVRDRAERIFAKLAVAESRIHRASLDDVHFHEVGAVDALADVVGTAAALDYLGVERILVAPLPIGRGFVNAGHGRVPLPAPATAELLRGFPIAPVDFEGELVTPTGAAIVAALAKPAPSFPRCVLERTGFGAGTKTWPDRPNVLRVALLRETLSQGEPEAFELLEANLDDANPEWLAHAVERLLAAGARDAWLTPITMKKGRAAVTLAVLAPSSLAGALAEVVFAETTAIGLRRTTVARTELAREIVDADTPWGPVPVKVVHVRGARRGKPEFDDCRRIAEAHGVPVRAVAEAALAAFAKGAPTA